MPSTYRDHIKNIHKAAAVLDEYKTAAGCIDCGFSAWPEALHFDHIDPQTKRKALGWAEDRSKLHTKARLARHLAHVEKYCVIRCANCHARRTKLERQWLIRRGGYVESDPTLF